MIISSWNVNSVRARIENIKEYLKKYSPDILMMQEIKAQDENYPYEDFEKSNYQNYVFGQKSYNGVAIISKKKLDKIEKDIFKDKNKQSRIITADLKHKSKTIKLINIYTPNGNPENDALFRLEIRKKLRELLSLGFHDAYRYIHPDKEGYTFWDYTSGAWQKNNGMRIDHFLVSNSIINLVKDVKINKFPRGRQKPSDHTPIEIELT